MHFKFIKLTIDVADTMTRFFREESGEEYNKDLQIRDIRFDYETRDKEAIS